MVSSGVIMGGVRFDLGDQVFTSGVSVVSPVLSAFSSDTFAAAAGSKTITVPNGEMWAVNFIMAILVTDTTVGNRNYRLEIKDASGNLMFYQTTGATVAASTTRRTLLINGSVRDSSAVDNTIVVPLPQELWLDSGWTIRLFDVAGIVASDKLDISYQVRRFKGA